MQKDKGWPCRSRSFFLELLFLAERLFSAPIEIEESTLTGASGDVADIILYLHTHYHRRITIEELTRTFHINRTTLIERFREATGLPVITYLIQLRVRLAALMLRDTELSITEILHRVGFSDHTHFGRTFRKHTGYSPSEYRKHFCWMLH
jgi:AraC family L-rhamnose operon regulatory protein RhaS